MIHKIQEMKQKVNNLPLQRSDTTPLWRLLPFVLYGGNPSEFFHYPSDIYH